MESIAGAAAGRRTKVKSVMGCIGNKTFLSFLQQVSALLARPAGQQFCSHGCGALIWLLETPCSALPFEEVLEKRNSKRNGALYETGKTTEKPGACKKLFCWTVYTHKHTNVCVYIICVLFWIAFEDGEKNFQGLGHAQIPRISGRDERRTCCIAVKKIHLDYLPKQMLRKYF